jgi:hypothetical protein
VTKNPGLVQLPLYSEDAIRVRSIIPKASPFVKWAGGKRKLIDYIFDIAPTSFDRYLEPFMGEGR